MEVFDRSLTHIPIEMHTKYLSNFHIKYISNSDQFVSSGSSSSSSSGSSIIEYLLMMSCVNKKKYQRSCMQLVGFHFKVSLFPYWDCFRTASWQIFLHTHGWTFSFQGVAWTEFSLLAKVVPRGTTEEGGPGGFSNWTTLALNSQETLLAKMHTNYQQQHQLTSNVVYIFASNIYPKRDQVYPLGPKK
jgi:hypothetical protein